MKNHLILIFSSIIILLSLPGNAQNVGIGTTSPHPSAKLEIESQNQGLLIPRMTTDNRRAIQNPAAGLLVYDTEKNTLYMFEGQKWVPLAFAISNTQLPPTEREIDVPGLNGIGYRVAIGELGIVVANDLGKVYFIDGINGSYIDFEEIVSSSPDPEDDQFGYDLAIEGNFLVVGAPGAASDSGRVYVFERVNNSWEENQVLQSFGSFVSAGDGFGFSIDLSENKLVIGVPFSDPFGSESEGAFAVFSQSAGVFSSGTFVFQPEGSGFASNDYFGWDVAIHGGHILVGAPGHDNKEGKVYFYRLSGGSINLDFQLPFSTVPAANAFYGYSVDIDSAAAIIGYPGLNNGEGGYHLKGNFMGPQYGDEGAEFTQVYVDGETGGVAFDNRFFGASVSIYPNEKDGFGLNIVSAPNKLHGLFSIGQNNLVKSFVEINEYESVLGSLNYKTLQSWESPIRTVNGMGISTAIWNGRVCAGHDEANNFIFKDFREE